MLDTAPQKLIRNGTAAQPSLRMMRPRTTDLSLPPDVAHDDLEIGHRRREELIDGP